jgi:hypothetical protein
VSLQSVVAKATSAAFMAVGDLAGLFYVRRETAGVFDPATGTTTPGTTTNYPCRGILTDYAQERIDGTNIMAGDRLAILDAGTLMTEPVLSDKLVTSDDLLNIIHIEAVKPNATAFLYKLQVRRS